MLRLLQDTDSQVIQPVFDACEDYALLQDGKPFPSNAAELEFDELPLDIKRESKRVFAIEQPSGQVVGLVEGVCGYPSAEVWFIGLMLIVPRARSTGLGALAIEALVGYAKSIDACREMEVAVLKSNAQGLRFWERQGFLHRREAPAARFGNRIHERWVLGKRIGDA